MDRSLILLAIGLLFGGGLGFALAAGTGVTFDGHDHTNPAHHRDAAAGDHAMMHDTPLPVDAGTAPTVKIALTPDPMAGFNLHVMVENFTFAPARASLAHSPGEGHAHVYVNGEKRARLYGPWMHLASLPPGDVTVDVTLNSNDHRALSVNGTPIRASATLSVE